MRHSECHLTQEYDLVLYLICGSVKADIYLQVPIKDYYLPMKNLVNWFSEDVVNRKREEIQKLLLRLLEKSNVNIESLNLPKLSFSCNHSESETQVCNAVHLFTEFLLI